MSKTESVREEVRPGLIIEYLQNNQPIPAWILEVQGSRVRTLNINQREVKLPVSRILPWMGPCYGANMSREDILGLLKEHNRKRSVEQEGIDILEVWEMAQGEISQAGVSWFASLIWSEPASDQVAALGRTMLQTRAHFKFSPPEFEIYPQEVVQVRLEQERIAREKERLVSIGRDFFKSLWDAGVKKGPLPGLDDPDARDSLKNLIVTRIKNPDDSETQEVWTKVTTGLPQDPNLAFLLGRIWGIYSPHHNYLLDQVGYTWDDSWEKEHSEAIKRIKTDFEDQARAPAVTGLVSIDSGSTRDIDDAFQLCPGQDGFNLTLALACPALFWEPGSELDRAVAGRTTSLYLPEGTSNMLPRVLAEDLFSLVQDKPRPAMILKFCIDRDGQVRDFKVTMDWVQVDSNLTYEHVEEELSRNSGQMAEAHVLADILRSKRIEHGAVIIEQNDPGIYLEKDGSRTRVRVEEKPACPGAQLIVSEFMILANTRLAAWAAERGIPLYYRTQDIALPKDFCGVWSRPEDIYQIIRSMGATLTETAPRQHRSLGAACYAPVTSPLRRYTDLVNQLQLLGYLDKSSPVLTGEEMNASLAGFNARMAQVSQIQRFRPRYWKLVYFKQNCKTMTWPAVVVDNSGPFVVLSLPRELIMVRAGHDLFGGKTRIGQTFRLRLGRIDPLNNEISVLEAWEE
ncbi:ribonuclease catalytic domain-containing protein [Desulfonatronovibrio hydrogenovorans]|uniref:ribonuclease catalytic domain-containing protein n=1 Tax=Desulfonatronovibrio hydrogenovorans TaxID=53245 RepID=UPI00048C85B7|nr:ribonuclease catalytic domain-containing protein [Desulfonatronovibrio hydrogenovorans]